MSPRQRLFVIKLLFLSLLDQYDQLGGNSQFGEDTAPITSVVGALDSLNPDGSYNYRKVNAGSANLAEAQQPSSQYLPTLFKV